MWIACGVQQWGLKQMNTQYWYYPLTFQSYVFYANCRAIRSGASGDGWSWYPVAPTLSYARFLEKDENAYCLSVGYQQWGVSKTYPINFETFCAKVYKRGSASNDTYKTIMTTVTTDLNKIGESSVEYHFIAIGI